jgi:hypothetical protein
LPSTPTQIVPFDLRGSQKSNDLIERPASVTGVAVTRLMQGLDTVSAAGNCSDTVIASNLKLPGH